MGNPFGRTVVVAATNKSGGGLVAGDVCVIDTTNNLAFTTDTAGSFTGTVGIAQGTIGSNATGLFAISGYVSLVNVNASVTRGHFGKTYTVAKQATDAGASRGVGTFCEFTTGGTTPDAIMWPVDLLGSSLTNPMTTTGDVIYSSDGSGTPARLAIGLATTFLSGGTTPSYKGVGYNYQVVTRTSGDLSLAQHTTKTELSSTLRLTLAATTNDIILAGYNGLLVAGSGGEAGIDLGTIVSGSLTNSYSPGSRGIGFGYVQTTAIAVSGQVAYKAVSGDISGGNIIVSPVYIQSSVSAGTAYADTTYGLTFWAMNLGH